MENKQKGYDLKKLRLLLTKGFNAEELRTLCFDVPAFEAVYDNLSWGMGKDQIIERLIDHARRHDLLDVLLAQAKERNPQQFERHQPYYRNVVDQPGPAPGRKASCWKAVVWHLFLGLGLFYVDGTLARKWLYPVFPICALLDLLLSAAGVEPFHSNAMLGPGLFMLCLSLHLLSFVDVVYTCHARQRLIE